MLVISFTVEGTPVAKGRPRFARRGNFISTYTPKKTLSYEQRIAKEAKFTMDTNEPLRTPVAVIIEIVLEVPKSYSKKRTFDCLTNEESPLKKPDLDNCGKLILDAMNGIVYIDDCQIISLHITKKYGAIALVNVFVKEVLP